MAIQSKVSLPVIKRLPKYYRYLTTLSADGKEKISSSELAHMMGTTASQVRQDFNCFGGFGQQGIGYKVDVLRAEIGKLLFGDGEKLPTILIGAGRLGSAVSSFISRDTNGYKLIGVFDINPELCGKEMGGATIYPLSELEAFCEVWGADMKQQMLSTMTVEELGMAILKHGFQGRTDGYLQLTAIMDEGGVLELHLRDDATTFNPFALDTSRASRDEDFDMDGMGVLVIKKRAKEFFYRRYQGFNTLIIKI